MESKILNEMLTAIGTYPYFLFLSNPASINSDIAALPWNCVFTTITDVSRVEDLFKLPNRRYKIITNPDMFEKLPNKKNELNIVFLLGDKPVENLDDDQKRQLRKNLRKYFDRLIPDKIGGLGHIVFDTFNINQPIFIDPTMIGDLIYNIQNDTVIFFDSIHLNDELKKELTDEFLERHEVHSIEQSMKDSFTDEKLSFYSYADESSYDNSGKQITVWVDGKIKKLDKNTYVDFLEKFDILTEPKINEISVPDYLRPNWFYLFLQNSANDYCWYGYQNKFNYIRKSVDEHVLEFTKKCLEYQKRDNYILLYGQSGSGKTVTVNYVAYKVFLEHKYPVIYLKKNQIDFIKNNENSFFMPFEVSTSNYKLLDDFMKDLEDKGSKNVLLICDLSLYPEDYFQTYGKLLKYLHNRGRNFVLLCTGYGKETRKITQIKITPVVAWNDSNSRIKDQQIKEFVDNYLTPFAELSDDERSNIYQFIADNKNNNGFNLFSVFYRYFSVTRPSLTRGIRKEAEESIDSVLKHYSEDTNLVDLSLMQLALKQAGLIDDIDIKEFNIKESKKRTISIKNKDIQNLLIITAICCREGIRLPSDLALKLLPDLNINLIKKITSIPFFIFSEEEGYFSFTIRSALDARILLNSFSVTLDDEGKQICSLIRTANLFSSAYEADKEIECIASLLHKIGPQYKAKKVTYSVIYDQIIKTLKEVHEGKKIDIRIVLIEMNYIREYYTDKYTKSEKTVRDLEEYKDSLKEAIELGYKYSSIPDQKKNHTIDMIKVETANARYRLASVLDEEHVLNTEDTSVGELYKAKSDVENIIHNPYSYKIWFQVCNDIYKRTKDGEILNEMINRMDLIHMEEEDIDENMFLAEEFAKLEANIQGTPDEYIERLIQKGNPVGICLKAKKFLIENNLNMNNQNQITSQEVKKYEELVNTILSEENLPLIKENETCLFLYIKVKWLLSNGKPFFLGDKELTQMSRENWENICDLCSRYLQINQTSGSEQFNFVVVYLAALCYAQLGEYDNALEKFKDLKDRPELYYEKDRVYTKHMLCDENGEIIKFAGKMKITPYGKISVFINKINNGRTEIFCNENNLKNIRSENGKTDDSFQVGVSMMGFQVYHGYNGDKND